MGIVIRMASQGVLLKVVLTLHAVGCLPYLLHGRQEQTNQKGNDGDHNQQVNQGERLARERVERHGTYRHWTSSLGDDVEPKSTHRRGPWSVVDRPRRRPSGSEARGRQGSH